MAELDMVIFDCDGVIVDSERLLNEVLRDDLAAHGLDLSVEEVMERFIGGTMEGVAEKARTSGAVLGPDWVEEFYPKAYARLAAEVELIPGIVDVLDALDAAGVPYAVGSNGRVKKMEITLGKIGLLDRFPQGWLLSGQDCAAPKPAPDVYLKAMALVGADPARCVVVEDSATGAQAGQAAGARVFGFHRETAREKLVPVSDVLFDDMAALPHLLGLA
ncbi:MAG: HAD family phosphatase [Pseudomonadota bacterium]